MNNEIDFAAINGIQPAIVFNDGSILYGDVITKEEMIERAKEAGIEFGIEITDEVIERSFKDQIECLGDMGNLASVTVTRNGNMVLINPKSIRYIEIVTI